MIKPAFLLVVALLPLSAHAQVYKCEVGDATLYQDTPCPGAQAPITRGAITTYQAPDLRDFPTLRRPDPRPSPRPSGSTSSYQADLDARNARVRAQARGELVPGMTKGQVLAMLGQPDSERDHRLSSGKICEYWSWQNPRFLDRHFYSAVICDGKVAR
ncbi:hypothetical protein GCM10009016_10450 [Halomonas beimenensis]